MLGRCRTEVRVIQEYGRAPSLLFFLFLSIASSSLVSEKLGLLGAEQEVIAGKRTDFLFLPVLRV